MYVLSSIACIVSITGKRWRNRNMEQHTTRWGWIGFTLAFLGFLFQTGFTITRWIVAGHFPTSNMFEYLAFLGYSIAFGFLIIFLIYRLSILGAFAMPVSFIVIAYASVFPREVTPLIPALQSYWLKIHVTTAALGEGIFAVGFAAGLMYLIRTIDQSVPSRSRKWLEGVLCLVLMLVGFILASLSFESMHYQAVFEFKQGEMTSTVTYDMPAITGPKDAVLTTPGAMKPLFDAPGWMKGANAARKLNTVIWSAWIGFVFYWLIRLGTRRRIGQLLQPILSDLDSETIDEISYRAIAIGYPIFTLGALIFAMIWASEAWGRFWGWDPKEVWALITWLFYTAYLHLRLSKGWLGEKSAWMAVLGFIVVMVTLVFVNLVVVGLHSYAQVG
ncbi:MAG TPA: c-type cytochrome biogenesis protein CcsB [Bacillota bacterium]|nr:c-type cytochrome biogenesis protein CcsB [Bacillota bacterium]